MDLDQASTGIKFVLHDRGAIFHQGFDAVFTAAGLRIMRSGVQMPHDTTGLEASSAHTGTPPDHHGRNHRQAQWARLPSRLAGRQAAVCERGRSEI